MKNAEKSIVFEKSMAIEEHMTEAEALADLLICTGSCDELPGAQSISVVATMIYTRIVKAETLYNELLQEIKEPSDQNDQDGKTGASSGETETA